MGGGGVCATWREGAGLVRVWVLEYRIPRASQSHVSGLWVQLEPHQVAQGQVQLHICYSAVVGLVFCSGYT